LKHLAFALLFLAVPALAQDSEIDARRLGVMVDESEAALHALSPAWAVEQAGDDDADVAATVRRFARMAARACQAKLMGPQFCATPYDPPWLATTPADPRAALDDAAAHIGAFWSEVCARAKPASPNVCVME
jgi:hypothetical protein